MSIRILHLALVFGLLVFWFISTFGNFFIGQYETLKLIFQYLVPLSIIACITASQMLYNAKLFTIEKEMDINKKTDIYKQAFVSKCALVELPAILSLIALILTGDHLFSLLAAGMIAYLIMQFPNKQKIIDTLPLNKSEIEQLTKIE